jgi:hypothetical protein
MSPRRRRTALPAETERKLWAPILPRPPLWAVMAHRVGTCPGPGVCPLCSTADLTPEPKE